MSEKLKNLKEIRCICQSCKHLNILDTTILIPETTDIYFDMPYFVCDLNLRPKNRTTIVLEVRFCPKYSKDDESFETKSNKAFSEIKKRREG